jgi:hypothetical protein
MNAQTKRAPNHRAGAGAAGFRPSPDDDGTARATAPSRKGGIARRLGCARHRRLAFVDLVQFSAERAGRLVLAKHPA